MMPNEPKTVVVIKLDTEAKLAIDYAMEQQGLTDLSEFINSICKVYCQYLRDVTI